ncbi:MAG: UDP-N-acetylmuramate--L-alanine ligase [Chloroflexia bacterium]|nr:UDP-N-acetylmuramate--L-alanine ligase [Chloroflexia bacterium]
MQSFQPSTITELPLIPASIHFVGVGGVSMSGLAQILHAWGYTVSGSDRQASPVTEQLASQGIRVQIGHEQAELAGEADILVVTPRAIPGAPEEIRVAVANGAQIVRRGQLLGMLANARTSIAVAGSHGKSSTSGMVTSALTEIGADPSYSVGAVVNSTGKNADSGAGAHMVVEADEFDRALLWLTPDVAVITTISFDHPDVFADQAAYDQAFADFASQVRPGGTLIVSADDIGCQRLLAQLSESHDRHVSIQTFGQDSGADWTYRRSGSHWEITSPDGRSLQVDLKAPGRHSAANATAAVMSMVALGVSTDDAIRGIEAFTGVGRRFELKGSVNGIDVIDDYGHHPDEISATIAGARDRYPDRRIVVLFQPHTFSRTAILLHEFATSLDRADLPVLLDIYPAGEVNTYGVTSHTIADGMAKNAEVIATPDAAVRWLSGQLRSGDVIITMGAGDVTVVGDQLLEHLGDGREPAIAAPAVKPRGTRPIRSGGRKKIETIPLPGTDANIQRDVDMSLHTTMRVGGSADLLFRASTPDLLEAALGWATTEALPVTVIGGGSNLLIGDGGIRGLVIVVRTPGQKAEELLQVEEHDDHVLLTVGAQAPISWVGRYCAEQGWSGMDWAVGLPGQIGGATVNNAGAHGIEIKDHLVGVEVFEDGDLRDYDTTWLTPSYRMTRVKGAARPRPWSILRSRFRLLKGDPVALVALADDHARFRRETQPTGACSGSTFANPEGAYAGRLLEEAGLKGYQLGAMQFSPKHANWVINTGDGSARDAWALIQHARSVILDQYGIDLRLEVERVGEHGTMND